MAMLRKSVGSVMEVMMVRHNYNHKRLGRMGSAKAGMGY